MPKITETTMKVNPPVPSTYGHAPNSATLERDGPRPVPKRKAKSTFRESKGGGISPELATLKALFKKHYYFSDEDVIDLVLGIVAGNHIDSDPIWLHLISAPSGGKTEL